MSVCAHVCVPDSKAKLEANGQIFSSLQVLFIVPPRLATRATKLRNVTLKEETYVEHSVVEVAFNKGNNLPTCVADAPLFSEQPEF